MASESRITLQNSRLEISTLKFSTSMNPRPSASLRSRLDPVFDGGKVPEALYRDCTDWNLDFPVPDFALDDHGAKVASTAVRIFRRHSARAAG